MSSPALYEQLAAALADRYRLERELGRGGMATVYLAHDLRHERKVAIKVLHEGIAALLGVERFLAEIRTTAALQHPGILPLFDSGSAAGQVFYVMPFVAGESLRARMEREGQLPVADAVRITAEVAEALAYAHRQGVIHRDIKPENILLQADRPVLADFGIALAVQHAGGTRLTQTGLSLGTPQYMSPEQAAAERTVDGRTDIYALGAVLFEMLTGEPPFSAGTTQALVAKLLSEEPHRVESLRKATPPHVAAALHAALEKVPGDRFQSAEAFARALRGETGSLPLASRALVRIPVQRSRTLVLAAGLLAAGILIGALLHRTTAPEGTAEQTDVVRFEIAPDSAHAIVLSCCGSFFAVSPDNRTVVFSALDPADSLPVLYARNFGSVDQRRIAELTGYPQSPFFSPDGSRLGLKVRGTLQALPLSGGTTEIITQLPPGFFAGATWLGDGRVVFAARNLFVVRPGEGRPEVLLRPDSAKGEREFHTPHRIAGTDRVLFSVTREAALPEVRMLRLGSSKATPVTQGVAPAYVTNGKWLLVVRYDGQLVALRFDPETGDTTGAPVRLANRVRLQSVVAAYAEYAASPGGVVVRTAPQEAGKGAELHLVAPGRSERLTLPLSAVYLEQPRFSPDGRRLAVIAAEPSSLRRSIYVYDFDTRSATRLTFREDAALYGWTPGGDSLLAVSREGRLTSVPVLRAGAEQDVGTLRGWAGIRSFGIRGNWLSFGGTDAAASFVNIGFAPRNLTTAPRGFAPGPYINDDPAIAPEGTRLAYSAFESGRWNVYVSSFPVPGDRLVVSVGGGKEPRWSADGKTLYYRQQDRILAVAILPGGSRTTASRVIATIPAQLFQGNWDVDPRLGRVVWVEGEITANAPLLVELNRFPRPTP